MRRKLRSEEGRGGLLRVCISGVKRNKTAQPPFRYELSTTCRVNPLSLKFATFTMTEQIIFFYCDKSFRWIDRCVWNLVYRSSFMRRIV